MNNDLEQFSEERLMDIIEFRAKPTPLDGVLLARIALAVKQAKPVAYLVHEKAKPARLSFQNLKGFVSQSDIEEFELWQENLYTTPPANSPAIPDGWKLVPIEPTRKMLVAAMGLFTHEELTEAWFDLVSAAPKPESE